MTSQENRRFVLTRHMDAGPVEPCVELRREPVRQPGPGDVLTRVLMISVDPANRGWASATPPSYSPGVQVGDTMRAITLDEVLVSNHPDFAPGDIVHGMSGWQDFAVAPGEALTRVSGGGRLSHHISVYGLSGLTAWIGLLEVGQPKAGETVVVSAAAGSVGSLVGQIAKARGCRVIGSAGSDEKCRWLVDELGFDGAVNYRAGPVRPELRKLCPDGIDVYFDNVGGDMLQAALLLSNTHARIVCCGVISRWDESQPNESPKGIPGLIAMKSLKLEGFIVFEHLARRDQITAGLVELVESGKLTVREDIIEGLENAPAALGALFAGENFGKRLVRVAAPTGDRA
ncbi:MAG: NADP-dependent oxidoreductase [Phenylobacterium sp.]|uniref:NADP-dependent oxidoreductase n=1 Tax=Phenylobacterium sp. TaxID=1871053 RepID=UPI001229249E|nr:NADP-dependent oxidoreductase [Phenylobacterium sp.]TAJ71459.1 MAG: NADP-dependent oxidoreductase [Phenylobacterium sp.]